MRGPFSIRTRAAVPLLVVVGLPPPLQPVSAESWLPVELQDFSVE